MREAGRGARDGRRGNAMQRVGRERHRVFVKSGVTADTTEDVLQRHFSIFGTVTDVYIPRALPGPTPKGFAYISFETDDAVQRAVKEAVHEIDGKHYPVGKAEPRPAERTIWQQHDRKTTPVNEPLLPWPLRYTRSVSPRASLLPGPQSGGLARIDMRSSFTRTPGMPLDAGPLRDVPHLGSRPVLPIPDLFCLDGRMGVSGRMPIDVLPGEQISRSTRLFVGGLPDAIVERHVRAHFQKFGIVEDVYFPRERHTGKRRGFCFVRFDTSRAAHFAAAQSPRVILGYEVGEIKVANERADDYGHDGPLEVGFDMGYHPERSFGAERGYAPERAHHLERSYGLERLSGYKLVPPPYYDLGRDLPRALPLDLSGELQRELPRDLPREVPRAFDTRLPIRHAMRELAHETLCAVDSHDQQVVEYRLMFDCPTMTTECNFLNPLLIYPRHHCLSVYCIAHLQLQFFATPEEATVSAAQNCNRLQHTVEGWSEKGSPMYLVSCRTGKSCVVSGVLLTVQRCMIRDVCILSRGWTL